jgi:hypothetical protein
VRAGGGGHAGREDLSEEFEALTSKSRQSQHKEPFDVPINKSHALEWGVEQEPFDVLINKSHALEWGVEWEKVSYAGSEGLRFKSAPAEGVLHEWGMAHPDRPLLPRDVAIEVRRVGPGGHRGVARTYADMEKMLAMGGVLRLKLLHDAQVPGPVSIVLEKPMVRPIGLGWTRTPLSPEDTRGGLRIARIVHEGLFDQSVGADPDHAGQKLVIVGDTISQVKRTDPGEVRTAQSSEEMAHLLRRVGSLEMVIHRGAPRDDYHCTPGLNNLPSEWADSKQVWCCEQFASSSLVQASLGCKAEAAPSGTTASSSTPADDSNLFNCDAGLDKAERGWSEDKKGWCCAHEQKGCEESADMSGDVASVSDTSDRLATQPGQALVAVRGNAPDDFNDKYQDVVEWTIRSVYGFTKVQLVAAPRRLRTGGRPGAGEQGSHIFHYEFTGTCEPGCETDKPPKEESQSGFRHELEHNLDAYNASVAVVDARICFGDGCVLRPDLPWEFAALALGIVALVATALAALGARRWFGGKEEQRSPVVVDESDAGAPWLEPPQPLQEPPTDTLPTKVSMIDWLDGLSPPSPRAGGSG